MTQEWNRTLKGVAGYDGGIREFQNAVATLFNIHYLLELEANNPEHVREYLKLADPAMESLLRMSQEVRASAESG